jgi:hypothetical protein
VAQELSDDKYHQRVVENKKKYKRKEKHGKSTKIWS